MTSRLDQASCFHCRLRKMVNSLFLNHRLLETVQSLNKFTYLWSNESMHTDQNIVFEIHLKITLTKYFQLNCINSEQRIRFRWDLNFIPYPQNLPIFCWNACIILTLKTWYLSEVLLFFVTAIILSWII